MISYTSHKLWMAFGALMLALALFAGGFAAGAVVIGRQAAQDLQRMQEAVHDRELSVRDALRDAEVRYRRMEVEHEAKVRELTSEYQRRDADARAKDARTIADLSTGYRRLRLQVASCGDHSGAGPAVGSAGGADGTARAELAPETAAALWRIAADGDAAIRQLTALQEWARSAVQTCNGGVP